MGQLPTDYGTPNPSVYGTIEELCPIEAVLMRGRNPRKPNENSHLPDRQVAVRGGGLIGDQQEAA